MSSLMERTVPAQRHWSSATLVFVIKTVGLINTTLGVDLPC